MITATGNQQDDISTIIDELNDQYDGSSVLNFFPIKASGRLSINVTDGGFPGSTYTASLAHGLNYKPAYKTFFDNGSQFFPTPFPNWLFASGASIKYIIRSYADKTNIYATLFFLNSIAAPPFYPVGTIFNVYCYILDTPVEG